MVCAPSEDSDQPGQSPSLMRVFDVRMKKVWVLTLPTERTAKTLTRLGGCPGWAESSLGAQPHCLFCHEAPHLPAIWLSIGETSWCRKVHLREISHGKWTYYILLCLKILSMGLFCDMLRYYIGVFMMPWIIVSICIWHLINKIYLLSLVQSNNKLGLKHNNSSHVATVYWCILIYGNSSSIGQENVKGQCSVTDIIRFFPRYLMVKKSKQHEMIQNTTGTQPAPGRKPPR